MCENPFFFSLISCLNFVKHNKAAFYLMLILFFFFSGFYISKILFFCFIFNFFATKNVKRAAQEEKWYLSASKRLSTKKVLSYKNVYHSQARTQSDQIGLFLKGKGETISYKSCPNT